MGILKYIQPKNESPVIQRLRELHEKTAAKRIERYRKNQIKKKK